jgi:hypothetical protein
MIDKPVLQEGKFKPVQQEGKLKLKEAYFYLQKNNRNPDGSDNMSKAGTESAKKYGRFNQCFVSTTTACQNQIVDALIKKGFKPSNPNLYIDERATLLTLLGSNKDLWPKPDRFLWENHRKFVETNIKALFPGLGFELAFQLAGSNYRKVIRKSIENGFQAWLSIKTPSGSGHLISVIGESDEGIDVCDPAGNYHKGYGDLANVDGRDVFYDNETLKKMIIQDRIVMTFKIK